MTASKSRLADVDGGHRRRVEGLEVGGPREVRREQGELGQALAVVGLVRVAALDARHRGLGQARLERRHGLRVLGGLRRGFAHEGEHLRDVGKVFVAELLRLVVRLEVIVAVGQSQATLVGPDDDLARVAAVLVGAELEDRVDAHHLEARDLGLERGDRGDLLDRGKLALQRREPLRLDGGLVHARQVEVADLLVVRARSVGGLRDLLEDLVQALAVLLLEEREGPPVGLVGGDRVRLEPSAVAVEVEVLARGHRRVHVRGVDAMDLGRGDRGAGQRGPGQNDQGCGRSLHRSSLWFDGGSYLRRERLVAVRLLFVIPSEARGSLSEPRSGS